MKLDSEKQRNLLLAILEKVTITGTDAIYQTADLLHAIKHAEIAEEQGASDNE